MSTDLTNPLVKQAIEAINAGNRAAWFALFAADIMLTDDGSPRNFRQWSDDELFGKGKGRITEIQRVEDNGLTVYANFHSASWGNFDTSWKFAVEGDNITQLDVAAE